MIDWPCKMSTEGFRHVSGIATAHTWWRGAMLRRRKALSKSAVPSTHTNIMGDIS